jgi:hypothetical protein
MLSRRARSRALAAALVGTAAAWGATPLAGASTAAKPTAAKPTALTGPYQLYCPATILGAVVLHSLSKATISPQTTAAGRAFRLVGVQVRVTFPQAFASEMSTLGPITGKAVATLKLSGATPSAQAQTAGFDVTFPKPAPPAGVVVGVPAKPSSYGPFTATSGSVVVEMGSSIAMTLAVKPGGKALKVALACTAFPDGTADFNPAMPWEGTKEPPLSKAISPVIALSK